MKSEPALPHPAAEWAQDARRYRQSPQLQLRLAAAAAHMRVDRLAARRGALIDLLSDGRPHTREEIWPAIADRLGEACWGKLPREALARDLSVLRLGGIRIAYSRRPGAAGYYLQHPGLAPLPRRRFEPVNWQLVEQLGRLTVPERNERAFAAADFALTQKRLILAEAYPRWAEGEIEQEARRQVFGASADVLP